MDGAMQTNDGRVTFRQLMEMWQEDFNAASEGVQIRYDNFTGFYQCVKVYKKGDGKIVACAAHLYESPKPGIEITGTETETFIPAEDPTFFPRLIRRIEERYRDLLTDQYSVDNGDIKLCD